MPWSCELPCTVGDVTAQRWSCDAARLLCTVGSRDGTGHGHVVEVDHVVHVGQGNVFLLSWLFGAVGRVTIRPCKCGLLCPLVVEPPRSRPPEGPVHCVFCAASVPLFLAVGVRCSTLCVTLRDSQ
jgi:hypothetical protein